jgi:hypothetical protein
MSDPLTTVWLVMECAPDGGGPDSVWSTQELAQERADALSRVGPYPWQAEAQEVDPDVSEDTP